MNELTSTQRKQVINEMQENISKDGKLGDVGYEPTESEIQRVCKEFIDAAKSFRTNFYLIYVHKMFEKEPYNCDSVSEFVEKYTDISRATFYRVINEIDMNIFLYGEYCPLSPKINSSICQELKSATLKIGALGTIDVWYCLNALEEQNITAREVKLQVAIYHVKGRAIPKNYLSNDELNEIEGYVDKVNNLTNFNFIETLIQQPDVDFLPPGASGLNNSSSIFSDELFENDLDEPDEDELDEEAGEDELDEEPDEDELDEDAGELDETLVIKLRNDLQSVGFNMKRIETFSEKDLVLVYQTIFGNADPDLVNSHSAIQIAERQTLTNITLNPTPRLNKTMTLIEKMSNREITTLFEYLECMRLNKGL